MGGRAYMILQMSEAVKGILDGQVGLQWSSRDVVVP